MKEKIKTDQAIKRYEEIRENRINKYIIPIEIKLANLREELERIIFDLKDELELLELLPFPTKEDIKRLSIIQDELGIKTR